mgnify:CR=1 FL=1
MTAPAGPGLAPLLAEGPVVVAHASAALIALGLGAAQLYGPKGTRGHRRLGRLWAALMAAVALSSLAIFQLRLIGPFSPIPALPVYTLFRLAYSIPAAPSRHHQGHRKAMTDRHSAA